MTEGDKTQARFDHVINGLACPICEKPKGTPCGQIDGKRTIHAGRVSVYYGQHRDERMEAFQRITNGNGPTVG